MNTKVNLVIKLFKGDTNSEYRDFYGDENTKFDDLRDYEFADTVTTIQVWKGSDYKEGDIVRLYDATLCNEKDGYIELEPRLLPYNLNSKSPFHFNDVIASLKIVNKIKEMDSTINDIYCIVELSDQKGGKGKKRIFLKTDKNLKVGQNFLDRARSYKITAGPKYTPTEGYVNFYNLTGCDDGQMKPGNYRPSDNWIDFPDNFKVESIQISKSIVKAMIPA